MAFMQIASSAGSTDRPQAARGREDPAGHAAEHIRQVAVRKRDRGRRERSRGSLPGCKCRWARPTLSRSPAACSGLMYRVSRSRNRAGSSTRRSANSGDDAVSSFLAVIAADPLGEPPIDDERLSERAEHDVFGLEVAVDDPAAVGVRDGIAGVDDTSARADGTPARGLRRAGAASCWWNRSIAARSVSP